MQTDAWLNSAAPSHTAWVCTYSSECSGKYEPNVLSSARMLVTAEPGMPVPVASNGRRVITWG